MFLDMGVIDYREAVTEAVKAQFDYIHTDLEAHSFTIAVAFSDDLESEALTVSIQHEPTQARVIIFAGDALTTIGTIATAKAAGMLIGLMADALRVLSLAEANSTTRIVDF